MRHKDKETALEALEAWKRLRAKVAVEGSENYDKPVLVQFLDRNTFEVMDRDIVEDEFYVLRKHRILRDLDPQGKDLDDAIRNARGGSRPAQPGRQQGRPQGRPQGKPSRRRPQGPQGKPDQPGNRRDREKDDTRKGGNRRRRRRTGRRGPRRGNGGPGAGAGAGSPPAA